MEINNDKLKKLYDELVYLDKLQKDISNHLETITLKENFGSEGGYTYEALLRANMETFERGVKKVYEREKKLINEICQIKQINKIGIKKLNEIYDSITNSYKNSEFAKILQKDIKNEKIIFTSEKNIQKLLKKVVALRRVLNSKIINEIKVKVPEKERDDFSLSEEEKKDILRPFRNQIELIIKTLDITSNKIRAIMAGLRNEIEEIKKEILEKN